MTNKEPMSEIESLNKAVKFEVDDMTVEELEQRLELSLAVPFHIGPNNPQVACSAHCGTDGNCGVH